MSRTAALLAAIKRRTVPASARTLAHAVEPEAFAKNERRTIDTVAATLSHLLKHGKVHRSGTYGDYRYALPKPGAKPQKLPSSAGAGRQARVLQFLAGSPAPANLAAIVAGIAPGQPAAIERKRVSSVLVKLVDERRVDRAGSPRNFHYAIKGRMPRDFVAPSPKPGVPDPRKPKPESHIRITAPAPLPVVAARAVQFETVEQFRARGGQIQRLPIGASSNPLRTSCVDFDAARRRHADSDIE